MPAEVYIPNNRRGWWGGPDQRVRCSKDDKVVFQSEVGAMKAAESAKERGIVMYAYRGKCGHWHTARKRSDTP